jgi:choline dehydrogenase
MGEAVAFFRSDDPELFPPAEYKHESKDANTDKDASDIELVTCLPPCAHMTNFWEKL